MSPAAAGGAVAGRSLAAGPVGAELVTHAGLVGLAERVVGIAQVLWPLTVVLSCRFPFRAISGSAAYAR
jgi:hypothetical protein